MTNPTTGTTSTTPTTRRTVSPAKREQLDTERRAEVEGLLAEITGAVTALHTEPGWLALLHAAARLHTYSLGNQLLVAAQCPEAQAVAGYRAWQALGRQVSKGSKGIRILKPITRTFAPKDHSADQAPGTDAGTGTGTGTGQREGVAGGRRVVAFGGVSVFDISQTDGPPVPDLRMVPLEGDAPAGVLDALTAHLMTLGWTVRSGDSGSAEALANFRTKEIVCATDRPAAHTVVSLAHEIAHVHLHSPDEFNYTRCRGQAEIEAESVAFIVATALGVQAAAPTSATYIAAWAQGDDKRVRAAAERVTSTSRTILGAARANEVTDFAGPGAGAG